MLAYFANLLWIYWGKLWNTENIWTAISFLFAIGLCLGGTQLWVTRHVPPEKPYFFSLAFTDRPPFLPTFTQCPLLLTNSLSPKDPDTSLSLKDPSFSHLIVRQVTIFSKKFDFSNISTNLTKFWEIFGHFGPESPYFLIHFTERPPFLWALSLKDPFLT